MVSIQYSQTKLPESTEICGMDMFKWVLKSSSLIISCCIYLTVGAHHVLRGLRCLSCVLVKGRTSLVAIIDGCMYVRLTSWCWARFLSGLYAIWLATGMGVAP